MSFASISQTSAIGLGSTQNVIDVVFDDGHLEYSIEKLNSYYICSFVGGPIAANIHLPQGHIGEFCNIVVPPTGVTSNYVNILDNNDIRVLSIGTNNYPITAHYIYTSAGWIETTNTFYLIDL